MYISRRGGRCRQEFRMLVLSTKVDEVIIIKHQGETLRLLPTVKADGTIRSDRLCFDAPKSFQVGREKVGITVHE